MHPTTRRYVESPEIARAYDGYFAGSALFGYDCQLLRQWLATPGRVLDLGCGTGRHLAELARLGHKPVGLDLSAHMLAQARAKLTGIGVDVPLVRADLIELDRCLVPRSFEYAICMFSTLGLIAGAANRLRVLRGARRALKPGGRLVLHVHNIKHNLITAEGFGPMLASGARAICGLGEWGDKIIGTYRGINRMVLHVFSRREIEELLTDAGLETVEVVPLNSQRTGRLVGGWASDWRANGFVLLAQRPRQTSFEAVLEQAGPARLAENARAAESTETSEKQVSADTFSGPCSGENKRTSTDPSVFSHTTE